MRPVHEHSIGSRALCERPDLGFEKVSFVPMLRTSLLAAFAATSLAMIAVGCGSDPVANPTPTVDQTGRVPVALPDGTSKACADPGTTQAINELFLGDTNRDGTPNTTNGWKEYGFNLDALISTKTSTNLCQPREGGAKASIYPDGNEGIDNSFGKNILPIILGLASDLSATANESIQQGDFTIMLDISKLGTDCTGAAGKLYAGAKLVDGAGMELTPKFDGTDEWPLSRELLENPSDPASAKIKFPQAYVAGKTWVSGTKGTVSIQLTISGFTISLDIMKQYAGHAHASPKKWALVDGDVAMFESAAICMYLAERAPGRGQSPRPGPRALGRPQGVDQQRRLQDVHQHHRGPGRTTARPVFPGDGRSPRASARTPAHPRECRGDGHGTRARPLRCAPGCLSARPARRGAHARRARARPRSLVDLESATGIRRGRLEALLKILAVDGVVAKDGSAWAATGEPYVHDHAKWDSLAATRRGEADLMRRYAHGRGCLMAFLQQALDDPSPAPCGRCSVCTGRLPEPGARPTAASIGSPIGKIKIGRDIEPHLERMRHAARLANRFGATYVRVFSFFIEQGDDPDRHRDEVIRRMAAIARIAEEHDVVALHENEKHIFGDIPRRCVDIVESVGSPHLRLIMDPANFVQCDVHPFTDGYASMRPYLEYMHIKDAEFGADDVLPAGEGHGQVREVVRALAADGFDGFFSLEPHLGQFDAFGGMCGPELWTVAHTAFTRLLAEEAIAYQ